MAVNEDELIAKLREQRAQRAGVQVQVADDEAEGPPIQPSRPPVQPAQPAPPPERRAPAPPPAPPHQSQKGLDDVQAQPRQQFQRPPAPAPPPFREEPPMQNWHQRPSPPPFREEPPMQMVPNPAPVQPAVNRFAGRLISRGLLADKYGYAFGAFGLVCTSNSFYTTSVGVHQIWGIMFGESDVGYVIGAIVAVALFLGQIFNSDWDQEVQPIDPDTEEPMEDENGDPVFVLEEVPNRKRNYILWLLPDAMFTAVFWMPRFARLLSHLLLNRPVEWTTVRDVWFAIPWHAIADGMPVPTWGMFFTFFFFVALPALALAAAWGVASAYFPEKALLGPRTRERMKAAMKAQFAQIQGALGA